MRERSARSCVRAGYLTFNDFPVDDHRPLSRTGYFRLTQQPVIDTLDHKLSDT